MFKSLIFFDQLDKLFYTIVFKKYTAKKCNVHDTLLVRPEVGNR